MKKTTVFFIIFYLIFFEMFSQQGILWNSGKLYTVSTSWFDIIYPEECKESAKILYQNADRIYKEVADSYGLEPSVRMPLVLTAKVELFNAYYTNGYYNHIVLYDTAAIDSLEVFSEELLSTFRHEVTHAFTFNMKKNLNYLLGETFGDPLGLYGYMITPGWAEGAAVNSESSFGEGRLNSEYAKHIVKQAKIEGNFPSYHDCQGASEAYPAADFYSFNAAFDHWLIENFGMEKYSQMWSCMVNAGALTLSIAFKNIYGIKLKEAWAAFKEDYQVPQLAANPVEAGLVKDLFLPYAKSYSKLNNYGASYTSLNYTDKGLFYIDTVADALYFIPLEEIENGDCGENKIESGTGEKEQGNGKKEHEPGEKVKAKKLLTFKNLADARASKDGRFIVLTYYSLNYANIKIKTAIYDTSKKSLFRLDETGIKNGAVVKIDDDYYLAAQKFHSQNKALCIKKLILKNNHLYKTEELAKQELGLNESIISICGIEKSGRGLAHEQELAQEQEDKLQQTFAFIKKEGLNYSIQFCNLQGEVTSSYRIQEKGMVLRDLSYDSGKDQLLFSCTRPGSLPQLGSLELRNLGPGSLERGSLELEGGLLKVWQENISGGIFTPVAGKESLFYTGRFSDQNRLLKKDLQQIEYTNLIFEENAEISAAEPDREDRKIIETPEGIEETEEIGKTFEEASEKYSPWKYVFRGCFIPFSSLTMPYRTKLVSIEAPYFFGTTFITRNPWDASESSFVTGYSFDRKSFATKFSYSNGTYTSLFKYAFDISAEFSKKGFVQNKDTLTLTSGFNVGKYSSLAFINTALINYNRVESDIYSSLQSQITFSTVHYTNAKKYAKSGINLTGICYYNYWGGTGSNKALYKNGGEAGFLLTAYCPFPLPSRFYASLFLLPTADTALTDAVFPEYDMLSCGLESILYYKDVQKAIPFMPFLLLNDFRLTFDFYTGISYTSDLYSQNWKITKMDQYLDKIKNGELNFSYIPYLKFTMGFTPNFGQLANSSYKELFCVKMGIKGLAEKKPELIGELGISMSF